MTDPKTLAQEIAEVLAADTASLLRLAEAKRKHDARREGKSDHPRFDQVEK